MIRIEDGGGKVEDVGVEIEVGVEGLRKGEEDEVEIEFEGTAQEASASIPKAGRAGQSGSCPTKGGGVAPTRRDSAQLGFRFTVKMTVRVGLQQVPVSLET